MPINCRAISSYIHAQAEKLDKFWLYLAQNRGVLIVETFNEGEEVGKKTLQHTITPNDRKPLGIAVIFEKWEQDSGEELYSFAMMTTEANQQISAITNRMPAVLSPDKWPVWLGETNASVQEAKALLVPVDGDWTMQAVEPKKKPVKKPPPTPTNKQPDLF